MNFDTAFERLLGHEGGYVDHPDDPGKATKYGISQRSYPNLDIKNLTIEQAKAIYKRDFWNKIRGDHLPFGVAFEVFDAAVNHGVSRAILFMQEALEVEQDGVIGPNTLTAAVYIHPDRFNRRFNGARLQFFTGLKTWQTFGKGWARRVASNLLA